MPFILDTWYVAAWPHEIAPGALLARTICGQALILFRDADGGIVALEDRCCHREAPLSSGWVEAGTVRCGYHGMRFDGTGRCVEVPGQTFIPPAAQIRRYPVEVRHGWVWVWPGDPARADTAAIPAFFSRNDDPDWTAVGNTIHVAGHYQLVSDNLLDLTHVIFVHKGSIGDPAVADNTIDVAATDDGVRIERWIMNHEPPPFWARNLEMVTGRTGPVDRWQLMEFRAPAHIVLDNGVAPPDAQARANPANRTAGVEGCSLNSITPETETSCWYFWGFARRFLREDAALSNRLREDIGRIFDQDRVIIEATQKVMSRTPGRPVVHLLADKGQNAARRLVAARLAVEQNARQAPVTASAGA